MANITGALSGVGSLSGSLSGAATLGGTITVPEVVSPPAYQGSYTVTPSAQAQVINTDGLVMADDFTVEPIPSNYGLITWNGSYLTVS